MNSSNFKGMLLRKDYKCNKSSILAKIAINFGQLYSVLSQLLLW